MHDEGSDRVQRTSTGTGASVNANDAIEAGVTRYDAGLVNLARAGDVTAFARLFDTYHGPITGYLYRLTGDRDAADDLAQETFIKALRALPATDSDLHFRPWLYRIATNTANSWHRRRRLLTWLPLPSLDRGSDAEPGADPQLAEQAGERDQVHTALRTIGRTHASILLLRHHQRLTLEETAEALGVAPNTAKVRLYRARKAFVAAYSALDTPTNSNDLPGKDQR